MIRLATAFIAATLALAASASAQDQQAKSLLARAAVLDNTCRGAVAKNDEDQKRIDASCCERQKVNMQLNQLGWCYGKRGQIGADMRWHRCTSTSQRLEAADVTTYCKAEAAPAAAPAQAQQTTCQGVLSEVPNTGGDNFRVGACTFTIDQYEGVIITDKCRVGRPCTVLARVRKDTRGTWITHAYEARGRK